MVVEIKKDPPRVPTRDELYAFALIFFAVSILILIVWAGFEIVNRWFLGSPLDLDTNIRPGLLMAFVFFLGVSYALYRKGCLTVFVKPEKRTEPVWVKGGLTKEELVEEAFRKLERPGDKKDPPSGLSEPDNGTSKN